MKKICLLILFSLSVYAEDCKYYLDIADKYREHFENKDNSYKIAFSESRALTVLAYQDRYKICIEIKKRGEERKDDK